MSIEQGVKIIAGLLLMMALAGATLWWWAGRGPSEVSAQEAVQNACTSLELAKYYDVSITATEYFDDPSDAHTLYVTMLVADKDFHQTYTAEGRDDTLEYIRVNGVVYERETRLSSEWKLSDRKLAGDPLSHLAVGNSPICPNVGDFREVGSETVDGIAAKRYSEKPPGGINVKPEDVGYRVAFNDLLVDKDGQLLKVETDAFSRGDKQDGTPFLSTVRQEMVISGIGEVNTIEAPPVGSP